MLCFAGNSRQEVQGDPVDQAGQLGGEEGRGAEARHHRQGAHDDLLRGHQPVRRRHRRLTTINKQSTNNQQQQQQQSQKKKKKNR